MTQQEELFAKFYNHEKVLVKDMDHIQLKDHRDELSKIAFEAKARLVAADDEARERKAKTNAKEWLVTDDRHPAINANVNVQDTINLVKKRAAHMSKMDKVREQLKKAGLDNDTINQMVSGLEKRATENQLKTIFVSKPTTEVSTVQVKQEANGGSKEPFNPANLKFGG